jgi:hypothetical protein
MIGATENLCCLCGRESSLENSFFDYAGRMRFLCAVHRILPVSDVNRILLTSSTRSVI